MPSEYSGDSICYPLPAPEVFTVTAQTCATQPGSQRSCDMAAASNITWFVYFRDLRARRTATGTVGGKRQGKIGGLPHGGAWVTPRDWAHAAGTQDQPASAPRYLFPLARSAWPRTSQAVRPLDNRTDLAEKADSAMYEDDEDRIDAAEQLAERNPHAAAEAFSAIACDQGVGDEVRLSAAELLADVDPRAAAPACLAIACDQGVGDEVRLSAAELLAGVDPRGAAPACLAIARDRTVGDEVRRSAAEQLTALDPSA